MKFSTYSAEQGQLPEKTEARGKAREVLVVCSMFNTDVFKMKDRVLILPCVSDP